MSGGKLYWTRLLGNIQRANLDGSEVEILVDRLQVPTDIALDIGGAKMYWSHVTAFPPIFGSIQRANLDGSGFETVISRTPDSDPNGLALDVSGGKIYWTDAGLHKIQRANLDGSGVEDLVTTGINAPMGIALDIPEQGAPPKPTPTAGAVAAPSAGGGAPVAGSGSTLVWFVAALAGAGSIALGGGAWYARRRLG